MSGDIVYGGAKITSITVTEDRWVPVAESGDRWKPRTREEAEQVMADYPPGGCFADGAPWDGITHIVHERRTVTPWTRVRDDRGAADTLWLNLGALLVGLGCGSYLWPPLAWALAGLLAYLLLAVPVAIGVGLGMRGGRRHG